MKKLSLLLLVFATLFMMTACQSGPKVTVEETRRPEATPIYSNADFRYGKISWNSSYSDVVRQYGKAKINHFKDHVCVCYYDVKVSDYTFNVRWFDFDTNTGRLKEICIDTAAHNKITMKDAEKLAQSLEYKYGEPDIKRIEREDGELSHISIEWTNLYEKTKIGLTASAGTNFASVTIRYINKDDTAQICYNDLPTPETYTPTPTPKPTATPNLNGI